MTTFTLKVVQNKVKLYLVQDCQNVIDKMLRGAPKDPHIPNG